MGTDENWVEYRKLILATLERLEAKVDSKEAELSEIKSDLKLLKQELGGKVGNTDFQVMKSKLSFWLTIIMVAVTAVINTSIKYLFE